jgi:hypothetical protein
VRAVLWQIILGPTDAARRAINWQARHQGDHREDNMRFTHRRNLVCCLMAVVFLATGFGWVDTARAQIVALGASNVAGRG